MLATVRNSSSGTLMGSGIIVCQMALFAVTFKRSF